MHALGRGAQGDQLAAKATASINEHLTELQASESQTVEQLGALIDAGYLDDAVAIARTMRDPFQQARALTQVAAAAATGGEPDNAQAIALSVRGVNGKAQALAVAARSFAIAGHLDSARLLGTHAESLSRTALNPEEKAIGLAAITKALAAVSDLDNAHAEHAEAHASATTAPNARVCAYSYAAEAAAAIGQQERANRLARQTETLARQSAEHSDQDWLLQRAVDGFASVGDVDHAEALAQALGDNYWKVTGLRSVAESAAQRGDGRRAGRLATQVETLARTLRDHELISVLSDAAVAFAASGDRVHAQELAREAQTYLTFLHSDRRRPEAEQDVARAFAAAGMASGAAAIARTISPDYFHRRATALGHAATAYVTTTPSTANIESDEPGPPQRPGRSEPPPERMRHARAIVAEALRIGHWTACLEALVTVEPSAVSAMAEGLLTIARRGETANQTAI